MAFMMYFTSTLSPVADTVNQSDLPEAENNKISCYTRYIQNWTGPVFRFGFFAQNQFTRGAGCLIPSDYNKCER